MWPGWNGTFSPNRDLSELDSRAMDHRMSGLRLLETFNLSADWPWFLRLVIAVVSRVIQVECNVPNTRYQGSWILPAGIDDLPEST